MIASFVLLIGYMNEGEHTQGCVFILYSTNSVFKNRLDLDNELDLDEIADLRLCSPKEDVYSRFGHAIATSSNDDGNFEIYIGAPTYGMNNLTYQGVVYYYESYVDESRGITYKVYFLEKTSTSGFLKLLRSSSI